MNKKWYYILTFGVGRLKIISNKWVNEWVSRVRYEWVSEWGVGQRDVQTCACWKQLLAVWSMVGHPCLYLHLLVHFTVKSCLHLLYAYPQLHFTRTYTPPHYFCLLHCIYQWLHLWVLFCFHLLLHLFCHHLLYLHYCLHFIYSCLCLHNHLTLNSYLLFCYVYCISSRFTLLHFTSLPLLVTSQTPFTCVTSFHQHTLTTPFLPSIHAHSFLSFSSILLPTPFLTSTFITLNTCKI